MSEDYSIEVKNGIAKVVLKDRLDTTNAPAFSDKLKELIGQDIKKVIYYMDELNYISSAGLRVIVFSKQKLGSETDVFIIGAKPDVLEVIKMTGFDSFLNIQNSYKD